MNLRSYCLSLPHTTEDIKWGHDLCFCIGKKMYAVTNIEGDFSMSLKVLPEEFEELTTRPNIVPAPYLARHHWVLITNISAFTKPDWEKYILQSYSLVRDKLPPKLRKQLSI